MKRFLAILVLLGLPYLAPAQCWGQVGGRSAPQVSESRSRREFTTLERASVRISNGTNQPGTPMIMGTGTIIASEKGDDGEFRSLILTNHHLFPQIATLIVDIPGEARPYQAAFLAVDNYADLGVIVIAGEHKAVGLASAEPAKGTQVSSCGYPHGQGPLFRQGDWAGFRGKRLRDTDAPVYEARLWSDNGDSGSGIYANGEVAAVLWGSGPFGSALVGLPEINDFLCKRECIKQCFPRLYAFLHKQPAGQPRPGPTTPSAPLPPPVAVTPAPDKLPSPSPIVGGPAGTAGSDGKAGRDGKDGATGKAGENGKDADPAQIAALIAAVAELRKEIQTLKQQPAQSPPATRTRIVPAKPQ